MSSPEYRERLYERYASGLERRAVATGKLPFWAYVAGYLPDNHARVYELGAGAGGLLAYLSERGFDRVSGVDGSPEQVALAQSRGISVEHGDVFASLCARSNASLDVVVAIDLVEHLDKREVFSLLDECLRVLAPDGRLIIHTVNGDSPFFGTVRFGDFTHETTFTSASMKQVLRTVGFEQIVCYEDRPLVHGVKSAARAVVWQFVRTAFVVALAAETGSLDLGRVLSQNFLTVAVK